MKKKVLVLGCGLVGKAMAIDLARDCDVTSADLNDTALQEAEESGIRTLKIDFADTTKLAEAIKPFDLVVGAVPGFLGFQTARTVINAGKNLVDISFFPEDPFELDSLARNKNVTVITDCGVAPGLSHIILGRHNETMKISHFECLVGGLPAKPEWPFQYKAVFSPIDVIEEYNRPARFIREGSMVTMEALSDIEPVELDDIGTLESFNSDGLRSLVKTMPHIPNMIEKTLRYPGTAEYMRVFREAGFFSQEEVIIRGEKVKPIDVTARLMFPKWKLVKGEEEFTVMRLRISGKENNTAKTYQYNLLDRTAKDGTLSMARTTGYTCTAAARLVLDGKYKEPGISPPEYLGKSANHHNFIIQNLEARGVRLKVRTL